MLPPAARRVVLTNVMVFACAALPIAGCSTAPRALPDPPPPAREFRGIFVATAFNLDWPPKPGLHRVVQANEINAIVGRARELNCNVIILQVRAFGDRIHETARAKPEPWSESLNRRHHPKYDPLGTWIRACHENGIELHAWVNPFRVVDLVDDLPIMETDDEHHMYLDYRSPRVQAYALGLIEELLNYSAAPGPPTTVTGAGISAAPLSRATDGIDAILFEHYFPDPPLIRPVAGAELTTSTPTATTPTATTGPATAKTRLGWLRRKARKHQQANPEPMTATWDDFIRQTFERVNALKPGAKFAISPRADEPKAVYWLNQGWVHYMVPELYMQRGPTNQFHSKLQSWLDQNTSAHVGQPKPLILAGLYTARVEAPPENSNAPWSASEIEAEVQESRSANGALQINNVASGQVHYSWSALRSPSAGGPPASNNIGDMLKAGLYTRPALVPRCATAPQAAPGTPSVTLAGTNATWSAAPGGAGDVFRWAVWFHDAATDTWGPMHVFPASQNSVHVPLSADGIAVMAVDRYNQESNFAKRAR